MALMDSIEQPLIPPSRSLATPDYSLDEQRAVEALSFKGILLKSWQIFRVRGFVVLPLAVLLQFGTYVFLPLFHSVLFGFLILFGALVLTLIRAVEMALAIFVTRKHFQREGSPSSSQSQTYEFLASFRRPWQIWGTSVINSAILYGVLGIGTFLPVAHVLFNIFPWWGPHMIPPTTGKLALFLLFSFSLLAVTTFLGSTLLFALPAAFNEGSTGITSNLRSIRLGKGQRQHLFGFLALSLLFNPLVDWLFIIYASDLGAAGQSWSAVAIILAILSMGPATAYFQIVWVVAYLSARKQEDAAFVWPPALEEEVLV